MDSYDGWTVPLSSLGKAEPWPSRYEVYEVLCQIEEQLEGDDGNR
jgi:hypothetical protein